MAARLLDDEKIETYLGRLQPHTQEALVRARRRASGHGEPLRGVPLLVYALITEQQRPAGAYDLIDAISRFAGRPVRPPTVYRAIDQLIARKLVARVASKNAFVTCAHPGHSHDCVLLVCDKCGRTAELEDRRLDRLILEDVRRTGFEPRHRTLEVEGTCKTCLGA